ncbi:hypothetical protein ACFE04_023889 [Oxalis oulophora]
MLLTRITRSNLPRIAILTQTQFTSVYNKPNPCPNPITFTKCINPSFNFTSFNFSTSSFENPTAKTITESIDSCEESDDNNYSDGEDESLLCNEDVLNDVKLIVDILKQFHTDCVETKQKLENCGVKVCSELVVEVISRVRNDWEAAFTFFLWAGKQPGYVHSIRVYHSMIAILGKMRKFDTAWMLIDEMRKSKGNDNDNPPLLTPQALLIMIRRYCAVHDVGKAISTFYAYKRFGFNVGIDEFQSLLSALSKYKNVQDAEQLMYCNKDVFPFNTKSFNIILNGWANVICSQREAERVWNEMGKRRIQYDAVSFGCIMSCYSKSSKLYKVLRFFDMMKKMGIEPDRKAYNSVIHALAKGKMVKEAVNLLKTMEEKGVTPNIVTYNSLIKPLCKSQNVDEAKGAFNEMLRRKLSPTIPTYHAFFRYFKTEEEIFELLEKMREVGCPPTNDTYIMLIRKFCRWRQFDNVYKMWNEMCGDMSPDLSSYIVLIHGLFLNGKVDEAKKYYIEMKEKGLSPDQKTDEKLQTWFSSRKFLEQRKAVVEDSQSRIQTKVTVTRNQKNIDKPETRKVVRERGFSFWEE